MFSVTMASACCSFIISLSLTDKADIETFNSFLNDLIYLSVFTVKKYLSRKIIQSLYPLHDEEEIKRLGAEWHQFKHAFKVQPISTLFSITVQIAMNILNFLMRVFYEPKAKQYQIMFNFSMRHC